MKQFIKVTLVTSILLIVLGAPVYSDYDFESNESLYERNCSNWDYNQANKDLCQSFRNYLEQKKKNAQDEINKLKDSMGSIQGNIAQDNAALAEIQQKVLNLKDEVRATEIKISEMQEKITVTENEIVVKENEISEKDQKIKAYMVNMQGPVQVNGYIEFIMGAEDFSEISRRMAGVTQINEYNHELIRALNVEKLLLEDTKKSLEFENANLVQLKADQENQVAQQDELVNIARQKIAALQVAYADLEAQQELAIETQRLADQKLSSIQPTAPSGTLALPVHSGYVSASQWYYPNDGDGMGGTKHMGVDFAASFGSAITAPANGLIIATYNSCASTGSWYCGSGFGNYVLMIMNVEGKIYGGLFAHMGLGSIRVSAGQEVSQGTQIGSVGNSGNSTGAHLHNELFYLGSDSVPEAYNRWFDSGANIVFNTGGSSSGVEYSNRCAVNGYSSPCRLVAAEEYGVYVGFRP